jgi:hypothetical protein
MASPPEAVQFSAGPAQAGCRREIQQNKKESLLLAWFFLGASSSQQGFFYGLLVSAVLAVGSYFALRWAMSRSSYVFLRTLLGGMLVRLIVIGGAMVWAWKFSTIDAFAFTVTVLVSYVVFQIIEVMMAQKQLRSARPAGK